MFILANMVAYGIMATYIIIKLIIIGTLKLSRKALNK